MRKSFRKLIALPVLFFATLLLPGCASHESEAWKSQPRRNTSALHVGMPRAAVVADFGVPIATNVLADGGTLQVFEWRDGYSSDERMVAAYIGSIDAQAGLDGNKPVEDRVQRARVWFDKNEIVTRSEVYVP